MSRARCVKHRYPDRIAAQLALTRIDRTNATKSECRAYRCANCCGWHLTSQPKAPASLIPDDIVMSGLAPRWAAAGPIGVADLGGLDIWAKVSAGLFPGLSNASEPSPLLTALVRSGHLGAKTGDGFYPHDPEDDGRTFDTMDQIFRLGVRSNTRAPEPNGEDHVNP